MIAATAVVGVASAQYSGAKPVPAEYKKGWDTFSEGSAHSLLAQLAGPEFYGRGTGQKGYMRAAQFVADQLKSYGVKGGMPDGGYFNFVPFTQWASHPASKATDPTGAVLRPGADFDGAGLTSDVQAEGKVVFFSGSAAELKPTEENCGGKIVFVDSSDFSRRNAGQFNQAKALAVIQVLDQADNDPVVSYGHNAETRARGGSRFHISREKYKGIAAACGVPASAAEGYASDRTMKIDWKIEKRNVGVPNVVGKIEGSDPVLKDQYVGLGSHLDHLGRTDGVVYPGADDDGSGTTALLLVAKAMMENPLKPKRSIYFMAFCGEEMGLLGSRYITDNPPFNPDKMTCELQMDMVGRNEEQQGETAAENVQTIHLVGSKRISSELHELTLKANEHIGFTFEYDEEDVYTRSDHAMFARKGIPITFLFSGFHPDYHRPTDTIEKINFAKIVSAARLNYLVAGWAANRPEMLKRDNPGS